MRLSRLLLLPLAVAIIAGGCSSDSNTNAVPSDTKAPVVVFTSPTSGQAITASELTAEITATDENGVVKVEFFLDGGSAAIATLTAQPWKTTISLTSLADGAHSITAKASDPSGNIGSADVSFTKGAGTNDTKRMVLVEIVTSANCPPCGPANEYFNGKIASPLLQSRLAIIRNHVWWPRSTDQLWLDSQTWAKPRTDYLFKPLTSYIAPCGWVDGWNADSDPDAWLTKISEDMKVAPEAKIELTKEDQGSDVVLTITVKGITSGAYTDLRLHTVMTESDIHYNDGNSEWVHYEVMRTMLPDANGTTLTLANDEEKTFTRTLTFDAKWVRDNMKAVVFLQANGSKKVLQAAKISLK